MLKQNHEVDSPPVCFGKHFDGSSPECTGGHDPTFRNDDEQSRNYGTQIRDTCDWVQSCSGRMQAARNFIPVNGLVRPPPQPASSYATNFTKPNTPVAPRWTPPQPYTPSHLQQQHHGAPLMSTSFGIPQYLSVREPQTSGGFGTRLARESLRSMLKSIGHTFAHFFDFEIFGPPPPGGGNTPGQ